MIYFLSDVPFVSTKRPTNPWLAPSICAADASRWCQSSSPRLVMQSDGQVKAIDLSTVWRSSRASRLVKYIRKKFARFLKMKENMVDKNLHHSKPLKGGDSKKKRLWKGHSSQPPSFANVLLGAEDKFQPCIGFVAKTVWTPFSCKKNICLWMNEWISVMSTKKQTRGNDLHW